MLEEASRPLRQSVHAGKIVRWFEELCRIKVSRLSDVLRDHGRALMPGALPSDGGVYCFWWTGDLELLRSSDCCRQLSLVGPGGRRVEIEFNDDWLGIDAKCPIPLYVGKTADSIAKRAGLHLMLASPRTLPTFTGIMKQKRPRTSCQVRAGMDQLFPQVVDTRPLVCKNLGLSYVVLGGDVHAVNRFYLEDLAIGTMRPALNIDIER